MNHIKNNSIIITDRMLRNWARCKRMAWLEEFGDKKNRQWSTYKTLQSDHQHKSLISILSSSKYKNFNSLNDGSEYVLGNKLNSLIESDIRVSAKPFLIRTNDISKFGDFAYHPIIIKQGNKVTREDKLSLSLIALLLKRVQGTDVKYAYILDKQGDIIKKEKYFITKQLKYETLKSIKQLNRLLIRKTPPTITNNRKKCTICTWKNLCNFEANRMGLLSEVCGIGPKRIELLYNLGINNIFDLSSTDPYLLEKQLGIQHGKIANQIVRQASNQVRNKIENLYHDEILPELKNIEGVLIYDIESDSDMRHDFLHGFVRLKFINKNPLTIKRSSYQPILNILNNNNSAIWKRLKNKLYNHSSWPILHYGETEAVNIIKLAKSQNLNEIELHNLKNRLIDIHARLRKKACLPITNYGLKSVSEFIGFEWSKENVDGQKALLWWRQWRQSRRQSKKYSKNLKYIFDYNRDDCLATWEIALWLLRYDNKINKL